MKVSLVSERRALSSKSPGMLTKGETLYAQNRVPKKSHGPVSNNFVRKVLHELLDQEMETERHELHRWTIFQVAYNPSPRERYGTLGFSGLSSKLKLYGKIRNTQA
jgi:hypothetical protein